VPTQLEAKKKRDYNKLFPPLEIKQKKPVKPFETLMSLAELFTNDLMARFLATEHMKANSY